MSQKTGIVSGNSLGPMDINQIATQLGGYLDQMKNRNLPHSINNNYSVKRKFFCLCASLHKCYYLDIEFPYFLQYKKKKFNWKAFINEFGSSDLNVYMEMCK